MFKAMIRRNVEKDGKGCSIMGKVVQNSQMTEEPKSVGNSVIDYGRFLWIPKYTYLHRYLNVKRQKRRMYKTSARCR